MLFNCNFVGAKRLSGDNGSFLILHADTCGFYFEVRFKFFLRYEAHLEIVKIKLLVTTISQNLKGDFGRSRILFSEFRSLLLLVDVLVVFEIQF